MNRLYGAFLCSAVVLASGHITALSLSLYWYYWGLDLAMHAWGGVVVTLGLMSMASMLRVARPFTYGEIAGGILVVSIIWELFEWWYNLSPVFLDIADTASDILMALGGGLLTYYVVRRAKMG